VVVLTATSAIGAAIYLKRRTAGVVMRAGAAIKPVLHRCAKPIAKNIAHLLRVFPPRAGSDAFPRVLDQMLKNDRGNFEHLM
jgi:hypothetical protein